MKTNRFHANALPLFLIAGLLSIGCAETSDDLHAVDENSESIATAHAELTNVPNGVLCVRVVVGSTAKNFTVSSGTSTTKLDLGQLPLGWQSTSATAYNVACPTGTTAPTASPTWLGAPGSVVITAGVATVVPIALRPATATTASVDFRFAPSAITTGYITSYAVTPDGAAWIWGNDNAGVAGLGTNAYISNPTKIRSLSNVKEIVAGSGNACALLNDKTVRCWGWNFAGQLGDGTTTDRQNPVAVSGLTGVTALASGYHHVCAVVTDGTLRCWGRNDYGQLGNGTNTNALTPVTSYSSRVLAVSAGYTHTCILGTNRYVSCSGANSFGQLGSDSTTNRNYFSGVSGLGGGLSAVTTGGHSSFAIRSDGKVFAWGANFDGQLGDGSTTNRTTAVAVTNLTGATQLSASEYNSCALMMDGSVKCAGYGDASRLGNGNMDSSPVHVAVLKLTSVVQLSTHFAHSCARQSTGDVYCWGEGDFGQIGDGLRATASVPSLVTF